MSDPDSKLELFEVMNKLDQSAKRFNTYIMITAINVLVCFVRFFKFVRVQERLNIVNQTLVKAAVDLMHFTLSFMMCFFCFAVMGCVMFGFKMTEFKSITDAFHALFNMSIGDTGLWAEMRLIHPYAGVMYQYIFFLFMGFTMINIFLAIIMDAYAEVVGEARAVGAHTIMHDFTKARGVFATSRLNPFGAHRMGKGTRVNYKAAKGYSKDPLVKQLEKAAMDNEDYDFSPDTLKEEVRPELVKFMSDTYSRMTKGETDAVADLSQQVTKTHVDTNHRMNKIEDKMQAMEARLMEAIVKTRFPDAKISSE